MEGIGDDKIAVLEIIKPLFHLEIFDGVGQIQLFLIGRELIIPAVQHIDELPIQFFGYMKKCLSLFRCRIQNVGGNIGFFFVETAIVRQITENMRIGHKHRIQHMIGFHAKDPAADIHAFFLPDGNGIHPAHAADRFFCKFLRCLEVSASEGGRIGDLFLVISGKIQKIAVTEDLGYPVVPELVRAEDKGITILIQLADLRHMVGRTDVVMLLRKTDGMTAFHTPVIGFQPGIMYHQCAVAQFFNGLLQRIVSGDAAVVTAVPDA